MIVYRKLHQWGREIRVLRRLFANWPLAVRHHYGLFAPASPPVATFHLRNGVVFDVEPGWIDVTVLKSIWGDRIYETFPGFAPEPGWTVLDLGAHKGGFTLLAARAGADVLAVEPEAHNLALLRRNLERNGATTVRVWEGAVAGETGAGELLRRNSWSHGIEPHPADRPGAALPREPVALASLDDLVAAAGPVVDLVKLDVEGAELAAFRAASPETLAKIRRVVLEYHAVAGLSDEAVGREIARLLEAAGFRTRFYPYNTIFADRPNN
jgi:FkbM family methyltransferase